MWQFIFTNLVYAGLHLAIGGAEAIILTENRQNISKIYDTCIWLKMSLSCHFLAFLAHLFFAIRRHSILSAMELDYINIHRVFLNSIVHSLVMGSVFLILGVNTGIGIEFMLIGFYTVVWFGFYYNLWKISSRTLSDSYTQMINTPLILNTTFLVTTLVMFISKLIDRFRENEDFEKDKQFFQYMLALGCMFVYFITHLVEMYYVSYITTYKEKIESRVDQSDVEKDSDSEKLEMDTKIKSVCLSLEYIHYLVLLITVSMISTPATVMFSNEQC